MTNDETRSERKTRRIRVSRTKLRIAKKLYFFMFVFFLALLYVGIYKIYDIKYVSGKDYETQAIYNQVNKIQDKIINPNRGSILDRNKQRMAVSLTVYNIILDVRNYNELKNDEKNKVLNVLNKSIGISMDELNEIVKKDETGKLVNDTNYKIIKKEVEYKIGQELEKQNLKCVYLEEDTKRVYPNNFLASQIVGFIRGDSSWGLEKYYNDVMTGTPGRIFRTYEADNSIITRQESAKEGNSLVTTIDLTIQQYAEKVVKSAYYEHNAENTSAIVMNPNTGEILAMASYPNFDLNNPDNISLLENEDYKKMWNNMQSEEKSNVMFKAWRNFNVSDTFEPGSIFKPIVIAAALEEGVIKETDSYFCGGEKVYEDYTVHCHNKSGHGSLNVKQILAESCNVGMMDIAKKLGAEKYYKYHKAFGYGEKTGIDLPAEESVENIQYSLDQLKHNIYLATSSFGQGFSSTAIQSMNAFAATINGGNLMKPYIVSQIVDRDGNIVEEHSPKIVRKVISQETSDYIRKSLESVMDTGTGKKAKIDGYAIGGKTGTAQQGNREDEKYVCSIISYLPVDNPDIMVGVFIYKPTPYIEGVSTPSPMLKQLLLDIINYKAIPPNYESNSKNSIAVKNSEIIVGEYTNKSLKEVVKELHSNNISYEVVGNGDFVYKQSPGVNNKIDKSAKVILFVKQSDSAKELAIVPNIVGMTSEHAKKLLENEGFLCDIVQKEETETFSSDDENNNSEKDNKNNNSKKSSEISKEKLIIEQYPNPEVKIEKGTVIKAIEN